jgi:integrase
MFPLVAPCAIAGDCYVIAGGAERERGDMQTKITKRMVDAVRPNVADQFLWDNELKGFGLKVTRTGVKVYILQYRKGGRGAPTKRVTIGRHGALTPDQARKEAARLLGAIANGSDPAAIRAAEKAAPTVAALADRFLSEHVATKTKPRTAGEYCRLIETIVVPTLGKRRVCDVTAGDVTKLHHDLRASPYVANRVLAVLSKMLNLAEKWQERPLGSNPCRHVERYGEHKRERMVTATEFAYLGDVLTNTDQSPYAVAAIRLLVFTGARLSEILALRWEWIDFERGEARLPDSKTGAKTLHLPPPALAVLNELPKVEDNPHVIVGGVPGAALVNLEKPWRAIRNQATLHLWRDSEDPRVSELVARLARQLDREPTVAECREAAAAVEIVLPIGVTDVRLHDLRHAFGSVAASAGMGLPIIGKMLGHAQAATTQRYAHLAPDPVKAAAAAVAGKLADALGQTSGGKLVTLPKPGLTSNQRG